MLATQPLPLAPPAAWLVLDIETGDAPAAAIQAAMATWKPPANIKDVSKIEARRVEAAERFREKAALLDASPVLCVAVQTEQDAIVFNGMDNEAYAIDGWQVIPCRDEHGMSMALREWIDRHADALTLIVGHNHRAFDLPKLRSAYVRHRLKLPTILTPKLGNVEKNESVDTMTLFKAFSMENREERFISLDTVAQGLHIPRPKEVLSGSDIPRLYREGQHRAICMYCCVDAATTARAFQLMTALAPDLQ